MNSPDVLHWKKVMLEEINALLKNRTWDSDCVSEVIHELVMEMSIVVE